MVDSPDAETLEGLADVGGRALLSRVRHRQEPCRARPREDGLELRRRVPFLRRIEPHAADPLAKPQRLPERRLRGLRRQVPQEAQDQPRGDPETPSPFFERPVDARDDGLERDPPVRVGLGIEEHLRVPDAVGGRARQIRRRQLEEVPFRAENAGSLVIDVEKGLQVAEPIRLPDFLDRGVAQNRPVSPRQREHHLRLERPLDVEMQLGLRDPPEEALHGPPDSRDETLVF